MVHLNLAEVSTQCSKFYPLLHCDSLSTL